MAGRRKGRKPKKLKSLEDPECSEVCSSNKEGIVLRTRAIARNSSSEILADVGNLKNQSTEKRKQQPKELELQKIKQKTVTVTSSPRLTRSGRHYTSKDIIDEVMMDTASEAEETELESESSVTKMDTRQQVKSTYPLRNKLNQVIDTPTVEIDDDTPTIEIDTPTTVSLLDSPTLSLHDKSLEGEESNTNDNNTVERCSITVSDCSTDDRSSLDNEMGGESPILNTDDADDSSGCGLETYSKVLLGRQKQMEKLQSLMGQPNEWAPPNIFIYGEEAVGKTLVIKTLLPSNSKVPSAYVSLKECYTSRILYESILNSLSGVVPSSSNRFIGYTRCDNLPLFIKELQSLVIDQKWEKQTTYIVLDDFDWILNMERTVCLSLIRLAELTNLNLCVIAVSRCLWEKYDFPFDTLQIHFPQYSKEEVLEILMNECPPEVTRPFYEEFLNHVWSMVHTVTRNIKELKYMCAQLFPIYLKPIESSEASEKDSLKLWHHIRPYCQHYLSQTYTRNITDLKNSRQNSVKDASQATPLCSTLPHFSKFLLIASYLASYNPSKCDQRFFSEKRSKKSGRNGTKGKQNKKGSEMKRQLIGPRPFTVDRMLNIFSSIIGKELTITAHILMQIPTLVSMGLLAKVSQGGVIDVVRYKCMVTFEVIRDISKSVNFEIVRFLYDYN